MTGFKKKAARGDDDGSHFFGPHNSNLLSKKICRISITKRHLMYVISQIAAAAAGLGKSLHSKKNS